jgi:hypothetical protein
MAPLTLGNGAAYSDRFTGKYAHEAVPVGRRAAGSSGLTSEIQEDVMSQGSVHAPARGAQIRAAIWGSCLLAVACLLTYWLTTAVLTLAYSAPRADDELGGLWAVGRDQEAERVTVLRRPPCDTMTAWVPRSRSTR